MLSEDRKLQKAFFYAKNFQNFKTYRVARSSIKQEGKNKNFFKTLKPIEWLGRLYSRKGKNKKFFKTFKTYRVAQSSIE